MTSQATNTTPSGQEAIPPHVQLLLGLIYPALQGTTRLGQGLYSRENIKEQMNGYCPPLLRFPFSLPWHAF